MKGKESTEHESFRNITEKWVYVLWKYMTPYINI